MSQIEVTNLTFSYEGSVDPVFEKLTLTLDTDWRLGLIGKNGAGKTTFLNLLAGKYSHSGVISKNVNPGIFPFEVTKGELPAADGLLDACPGVEPWRVFMEASIMGLDEGLLLRPFNSLSGGEKTRLQLCALFAKEDGFLLIDEPTNHLDLEGRQAAGRYLSSKKGFILVSHDRAFLDSCIDHVMAINKTGVEIQKGNFSSWLKNRDYRESFERAQSDKLKKEISRLTEASRRTASWSDKGEQTKYATKNSGLRPDRGYIGHKAAKVMKRAISARERTERAIEEKSALLKNVETIEALSIRSLSCPGGLPVRVYKLSASLGGRALFKNLTFDIKEGERIAVTGKNGAGKSTLLKAVVGSFDGYSGEIKRGSGLVISYVPQDCSFLAGPLSSFITDRGLDESLFKTILRKLGFSRSQFDLDMSGYSAGQKKKVLLAASLCAPAHIYIWDEPLNYIDLPSRMQFEELITSFGPTMLFVEHDAAFVAGAATCSIDL